MAVAPAPEEAVPAARPRGRDLPPLQLVVFLTGTATLGAEIAAARLLAPYFGASTIIWANTIGVVLVALSIGYWFGGRLADRRPDKRSLCALILLGAAMLAVVPLVSDPFLDWSISAFDELSAGAFVGSLIGVLVLVATPLLLLGAVSPWAIRLRLQRVEDSGQLAGRMYAISTIGSLVGTMTSSLLLIPFLGTQRTFMLFALILCVVAALGVGRWAWLVPVAVAGLMLLPEGQVKEGDLNAGARVVYEAQTESQYVRVVEQADGERWMELNEGQAIHSIYRRDTVLTGNVWDGYLSAPFAALDRVPRKVAILGVAGGTTVRAYERYFPRAEVDAVEIDGELFDIAHKWFGLRERPEVEEVAQDARPFLRRSDGGYDAIFVDAYRQPYIPFYLSTQEFFALAKSRLAPGGVLVINVGHPEGSDKLEQVLSRTVETAFPHVMRDPKERTNTLLIASERPVTRENLLRAAGGLPQEVGDLAREAALRLRPTIPGGRVYTDDKAPVELLIDSSIVDYAAG